MSARTPVVLGYYPSWQTEVTPDKLDYRLFTHIAHAFATVGADGALRLPDPAQSRDLCARAHRAGTRVLLALGGADSNKTLTRATSTPPDTDRLVAQLMDAVTRTGYDGVDVDWEFPESDEDVRRMNTLVQRLRTELSRRGSEKLVTMATPASDWNGRRFDRDALLPHLDWAAVMTYDFHGPWSDHAGHNAPLHAAKNDRSDGARTGVEAALAYWTQTKRWPREKLLLGIPVYGRGFAVSQWYEKPQGKPEHPYIGLRDVLALQTAGWTRRWDEDAGVPFLEKPGGGGELISYEDEVSAAAKGRWARGENVGGIFFWEITQDWTGGAHPLVRAARRAFRGE